MIIKSTGYTRSMCHQEAENATHSYNLASSTHTIHFDKQRKNLLNNYTFNVWIVEGTQNNY